NVPRPKGVIYATSRAPAQSRQGRLALRRVGSEAVVLVAEDAAGELLEIKRYPFTDQPMRLVTLFLATGGSAVDVRARLYDLQVRTGADVPTTAKQGPQAVTFVPMPRETEPIASAEQPEPSPVAPPPTPRGQPNWWLGGVGFLLGLAVGI